MIDIKDLIHMIFLFDFLKLFYLAWCQLSLHLVTLIPDLQNTPL